MISNEKELIVNREVRDTLFTHLFKKKEYCKKLYLALHPEDKDIKDEEIETITLERIMIHGEKNDLAMRIRNVLIILSEAQSRWSPVIVWRMLVYLGETYKVMLRNPDFDIYGTKPIKLPRPELYVIYTGDEKIEQEYISLKDYYVDSEYKNKDSIKMMDCLDLKVKIISKKDFEKIMTSDVKNDIISEYIAFVSTYEKYLSDYSIRIKETEQVKERNKLKKEFVNKVLDECIDKNILKEYLTNCKSEVTEIMDLLFDQEYATEVHERAIRKDAFNDGMQQGIQKGEIEAFVKLYKEGIISVRDAAKMLDITENEFLQIAK